MSAQRENYDKVRVEAKSGKGIGLAITEPQVCDAAIAGALSVPGVNGRRGLARSVAREVTPLAIERHKSNIQAEKSRAQRAANKEWSRNQRAIREARRKRELADQNREERGERASSTFSDDTPQQQRPRWPFDRNYTALQALNCSEPEWGALDASYQVFF